jgi:hypothetical protein
MRIAGKRVVDATKAAKLRITKRDVALGDTKDPGACAAARSILREFEGAKAARVHLGRVYVEYEDKWVRYRTPTSLKSEVIAFDRGGQFSPGEYHISPICPQDRFGHVRKKPKGSGKGRPKIARRRHYTENVRVHGANR